MSRLVQHILLGVLMLGVTSALFIPIFLKSNSNSQVKKGDVWIYPYSKYMDFVHIKPDPFKPYDTEEIGHFHYSVLDTSNGYVLYSNMGTTYIDSSTIKRFKIDARKVGVVK